jgi:hypothetical protein
MEQQHNFIQQDVATIDSGRVIKNSSGIGPQRRFRCAAAIFLELEGDRTHRGHCESGAMTPNRGRLCQIAGE